MPPGSAVTLPRDWLLALDEAGEPEDGPPAVDLTVTQLAALFGKKCSTIRAWLEEGDFEGAYKLRGRQWRVPRRALEACQRHEQARADTHQRSTLPEGPGRLDDYKRVRAA
jgi:excisionase family DNA binding protein